MTGFQRIDTDGRLRRVIPADAVTGMRPRPGPARWATSLLDFAKNHPWFVSVVVVPTLIALAYYGVIASNIYISRADYVVHSVDGPRVGVMGTMLQSVGLATSRDNAYSVRAFILSRDIVHKLVEHDDLRTILSRPEGDFVTRFPPPFAPDNFEELYRTYRRFVSVTVNETTGISTLRVQAYRPGDADRIAHAILSYSEALVNRLNARARHDAIAVADQEVADYERQVSDTQAAITKYRLENQMLDPNSTSSTVFELVARLETELATSEANLSELTRTLPSSPQIPPLRQHIAALQHQVAAERGKVVGGNGSVVMAISTYERLLLALQFADKGLASAISARDQARLDAERKQIYLDRVVEPDLPDYPEYPRRFIDIIEVLATSLLIYGIGWLVTASVREHVGR